MNPLVACIVVHFRSPDSVIRLVQSLQSVRCQNKEIIVVDNGSGDETVEKLQQGLPASVKLLKLVKNVGYAAGANAGIEYAQGLGADYYWILTQDLTFEPDNLEVLTSLWPKLDKPGFLGSLTDINNSDYIYFYHAYVNSFGKTNHSKPGAHIREIPEVKNEFGSTDYVNGACIFTSRSVVERIGHMPEAYFLYYEDSDWGLKARQAGYRNYVSFKSRVHHHRNEQKPQWTTVYYCLRNSLLFKRRNGYEKPWTKLNELTALRIRILKLSIKNKFKSVTDESHTRLKVLKEVARDLRAEHWGPRP